MPQEQVQADLNGFLGYTYSLDSEKQRKDNNAYALSHIRVVQGLIIDIKSWIL